MIAQQRLYEPKAAHRLKPLQYPGHAHAVATLNIPSTTRKIDRRIRGLPSSTLYLPRTLHSDEHDNLKIIDRAEVIRDYAYDNKFLFRYHNLQEGTRLPLIISGMEAIDVPHVNNNKALTSYNHVDYMDLSPHDDDIVMGSAGLDNSNSMNDNVDVKILEGAYAEDSTCNHKEVCHESKVREESLKGSAPNHTCKMNKIVLKTATIPKSVRERTNVFKSNIRQTELTRLEAAIE